MLIVLVGPKGSGKSHIGRILERRLGVLFFHVEPLWMEYHASCRTAGRTPTVPEGIQRVHPCIVEALRKTAHVCVETTGASDEILNDLLSLAPPKATLPVRVSAPPHVCLSRIEARDPTNQIPMDADSIRKVNVLSRSARFEPAFTLENASLSDDEIVAAFRKALPPL